MRILERILGRLTRASGTHPSTLSNPQPWLVALTGGAPTKSGETVNETRALGLPGWYGAVRVLADSVAQVPFQIIERRGELRRKADDHPKWEVLHDAPNSWQTSPVFREQLMFHVLNWGNGYAEIVREPGGRETLWPIPPWRVTPLMDNRQVWYDVSFAGLERELGSSFVPNRLIRRDEMIHVPGPGWDGLKGICPVYLLRENLGLGIALEEHSASFFGSGAHPGGVLAHPNRLDPATATEIRDRFESLHVGSQNKYRVAVLQEGMTWTPTSLPNDAAQLLQSREFSILDFARILRVPPHMIASLKDGTDRANIEQQGIEFVRFSLSYWTGKIEMEFSQRFLDSPYQAKLNLNGLQKGTQKERYELYGLARQWGILNANECREFEDLEPYEGGGVYLAPMNMADAESFAGTTATPAGDGSASPSPASDRSRHSADEDRALRTRKRIEVAMRSAWTGATRRVVIREETRVNGAVATVLRRQGRREFKSFLADFYGTRLRDYARRAFVAPAEAEIRAIADTASEEVGADPLSDREISRAAAEYADGSAIRYTMSHEGQLIALVDEHEDVDEAGDAVLVRTQQWTERQPNETAVRESVEAGSFAAKLAWLAAGIVFLRWRTFGDNCPLCREFQGRRVGVDSVFLPSGGVVDPQDGKTSPLETRRDVRFPPLHQGCDCTILPG